MGQSVTGSSRSSVQLDDWGKLDEPARLAAVRRYEVLDTPPDGTFDRITALAARLFEVPISIVSIVDEDRIWFKSHQGIDATEIGRDPGLCASAICQYEPWLVTDAAVDVRTLANPLVAGELGLRFYLGIPLTTSDGYNLGTLNVIDLEPRNVSEAEIATLSDLAAVVVDELELRLATRRTFEDRRRRALELNDDVIQGLASAQLAFQAEEVGQARKLVESTLQAAQAIVSGLLSEAAERGPLAEGDLVRSNPVSLTGRR
jgi:GAF domain-containing protein